MWLWRRRRLDAELLAILADQEAPVTLDQLVHQLFHRRERINDLLVLSRASIKRKQRLKRSVAKTLDAGLATKVLVSGQWVYTRRVEARG